MRRTAIFLSVIILLSIPQFALAQLGRWGEEPSSDGTFKTKIKEGNYHPFLELNYGSSKPRFEGLNTDFGSLGMMELKLGYASTKILRKKLVSLDQYYAFGSYFDESLALSSDSNSGEAGSQLTRFGMGNRLGYGYGGGLLGLEMYNQNSINWTLVEPVGYDTMAPDAQAVFDRYGSSYRFGQLMEAGMRMRVFRSLSVSLAAEGAVIFPRTVYWPWMGSALIYSGAQGALQFFSEQIIEVSPIIGPMLHFVLKSGVSYVYYMALRDDMAWPFDYETPMTVESLKIGATITF